MQPSAKFVAEMVPGNHQHILTDIALSDTNGNRLLLAKKPSMLHLHFEIVDPQGAKEGEVNHKQHLTHQSFEVSDLMGSLLGRVNVGAHRRGTPPNVWVEDSNGNKVAEFGYGIGFGAFEWVRPDGSRAFTAKTGDGSSLWERVQHFRRKYEVDLYDANFSPVMIVGALVAVETAT
jgi:hypothetical protein